MTTIHYIGATWCSTCKVIKPKTIELAKRFHVELKCFDYDSELSEEERDTITKVPTLRIFKENVKVAEYNTKQVEMLEVWLQANVRINPTDDF
jgi:thiol-disulfide isomerase/thioredoxin